MYRWGEIPLGCEHVDMWVEVDQITKGLHEQDEARLTEAGHRLVAAVQYPGNDPALRARHGDGMRRRFATRRNGFERVDKAGYPGAVAGSKCHCSVLLMTNQC